LWVKRLQGITHNEKSVTLTFEDGTQEVGYLLIGAEGAHSLTREYLLGKDEAQLIDSDVVVTVSLTTLDKEAALALRKMHPRYCIVVHPNGVFVWASSKYITTLPATLHLTRTPKFTIPRRKIQRNGHGC
jgi:2-polyprenyl-6-methoxyphenol hydroxylase-like FAD-dependent oxidoreductase